MTLHPASIIVILEALGPSFSVSVSLCLSVCLCLSPSLQSLLSFCMLMYALCIKYYSSKPSLSLLLYHYTYVYQILTSVFHVSTPVFFVLQKEIFTLLGLRSRLFLWVRFESTYIKKYLFIYKLRFSINILETVRHDMDSLIPFCVFFFTGKSRIRVQISASHSQEEIEHCVNAFIEVGKKKGVI